MNKSIFYYIKRKIQNYNFQQLRLICNQQNQQENDGPGEGPISNSATTTANSVNKNNQKLNKIAIIGLPNAGKSTFINNLISHRVCPTSNKVHTTRDFSKAIYTKDNSQIILFDTPGLVTDTEVKKFKLEKQFVSTVRHSIQHSNFIGVIQDVSNRHTRHQLHPMVLNTLKAYPNIPSFLVLNKIDAIKSKRILLDIVRQLTNSTLFKSNHGQNRGTDSIKTSNIDEHINLNEINENSKKEIGWSNFLEIFMVSSLTGNGLDKVMSFLFQHAKENVWEYNSNEFSDRTPEQLIVSSVSARLLDYLPQEIPYNLKSNIEYLHIEKGKIFASVNILCPSVRIEKLVCGEGNGKLRQITERITSDLVETFKKPITLTLSTNSKNNNE